MGKMDKTEKYTVAGLCFGGSGVFLCEDAVVCARVYGYCDGTVVEFCLGIACIGFRSSDSSFCPNFNMYTSPSYMIFLLKSAPS